MCRIIGIISRKDDIMTSIIYGLVAQNYAASKSCGFAVSDHIIRKFVGDGLANQQFSRLKPSDFPGRLGIGHVACEQGMQMPVAVKKNVILALDGSKETAEQVIKKIKLHPHLEKAIEMALSEIESPFALVILTPSKIIAARNNGRMPLSFGKVIDPDDKEDPVCGYYVASQSGVLGNDGEFIHSVFPGEMVTLEPKSYTRKAIISRPNITRCLQELMFYQRPDNFCGGREIHGIRLDIGKALGTKFRRQIKVEKPEDWIAIPILQGGADILNGFGETAGIPFDASGSVRSKYLRNPNIPLPNDGYTPIEEVVRGKKVVIVDDSLLGGRRMEIMARLSIEMGAKECYTAVASLIRSDCKFGKDITSQLKNLNGLLQRIHVQKLVYLTSKELNQAINNPHRIYCDRCLTP